MAESRFIPLLILSLSVLTGLTAGASVGFDQSAVTVMPGDVKTVNLTLDSAPDGLSGYRIFLSMGDPSVGEITDVTLPGWAEFSEITGTPGPEIRIMAADLNNEVKSGATGILLVMISVKGLSPGTTDILITDSKFDDEDGFEFAPTLSKTSFIVTTEASALLPTATTTTGSGLTGGSGGGGSGGGFASGTITATTPAPVTTGAPTAGQTEVQTTVETVPVTSPAAPPATPPGTGAPATASQGIPFLTVPGVLVLIGALVLMCRKMR